MTFSQLPLPKATVHAIEALKNDQDMVFHFQEQSFIALKHTNTLYIYRNQCPHQNKQLGTEHCLDETASLIECQYHAAQFLPQNGRCISGPCQGLSLTAFTLKKQLSDTFLIQAT